MVAEQRLDAAGVLVLAHFLAAGFFQRAPQEQRNHRRHRTDHKRNPPAVGTQFVFIEELLQDHHQRHRQQLSANQGHVLERREEPALALERDFAHVGRRGAVFAAHRQALQQTSEQQQDRRPDADAGVRRQTSDQQRAEAHHQNRDQHRILAPVLVRDTAEDPAANRPHQKPGGENARGVYQLHRRVVGREKRRGEIDRTEGVDVEVEPFDEVAGRGADNGEDPLAAFFAGVERFCSGGRCHCFLLNRDSESLDILCNSPVPQQQASKDLNIRRTLSRHPCLAG
ncbi:hypothetical protein D3C87_1327220 [compost metagenome]